MPYFLSALTYTPFLPIQTEFYEKVGASNYGKNRKNILANGAFLLSYFPSATATKIVMNKNMEYFDAKNVKIGRVELYRLVSDTTPSTSREGFESGTTDSFVVNIRDTIGWEKYVTGTDKTGTRENPANADAFTKESVGDGSTFTFALNSERDPSQDGPTVTGSIFAKNPWNETDADNRNINIVNANKALKLKSVRKLILSSLDFPTYNTSNGNDPYEQVKEAVNTYTPHDFYIVQGENDKVKSPDFLSYIEGAYIDRYLGERTDENWKKAEDLLGPGSIGGVAVATKPISEQTDADKAGYTSAYQTMYSAAKADIDAYNAANPNDKINLPIVIEYTGLAYNNDSDTYDRRFVNQTNANMNGCWVGGSDPEVSEGRPTNVTVCPDSGSGYGSQELVRIVKNTRDNIPQGDDYSIVTSNGATTLFVTGWGPDYSDPLTYASTLVKDGDLCDYFGVCSNSDAAIDAQVDELIGPYTELVEKANAIIEPVKRAEAFAEAEVELLFETYLMRPLYMRSQGVNVGVSRTIPYRVTEVPYGMCQYKYKSVEKLAGTMLSNEQRKELKAEYERLKVEDLAKVA